MQEKEREKMQSYLTKAIFPHLGSLLVYIVRAQQMDTVFTSAQIHKSVAKWLAASDRETALQWNSSEPEFTETLRHMRVGMGSEDSNKT